MVTLERNILLIGLVLTVTAINIKKGQKQENKNIKNVKRCRDDMQTRYRDDIIVKLNLQSPYPYIFYTTIAN